MKNTTKKAYPFRVFDFLLSGVKLHKEHIDRVLSETKISGRIPALFYRHSLAASSPVLIDYYGGYIFSLSHNPKDIEEIIFLDHVLSGAQFEDGYLFFEAENSELPDLCSGDHFSCLQLLMSMSINVSHGEESAAYSLFDRFSSRNGKTRVEFGQILKGLYALDYTVEYRYAELHKAFLEHDLRTGSDLCYRMLPLLRNILSRTAKVEGSIPMSREIFKKAGILFSPEDILDFKQLFMSNEECVSELTKAGVAYDHEINAFKTNNRYELSIKPGTMLDDISEVSKEKTDKTIAKAQTLSFTDLELTSDFEEMARMEGVGDENIFDLFEDFKKVYQDLQDQRGERLKYKDASRCFKSYLAKNRRFAKVPNVGLAENIIYDTRMDEVTRSFGADYDSVQEIFDNFKRYHLDKGSIKKDWYPSWRAWLGNNQKFFQKQKSGKVSALSNAERESIEKMVNLLSSKIVLIYRSVFSGKGIHRAELEEVAKRYEEKLDGFKDKISGEKLFTEDEVIAIKRASLPEMLRVYVDEDLSSLKKLIEEAFKTNL